MEDKLNITKDKFSAEQSVELVTSYLENYQNKKIFNYLEDIHNADIAELLQNLDPVLRLSLLNIIRNQFDPEILTYLNDSLREEIVETLDIKQLASNAKQLDIDDAVDLLIQIFFASIFQQSPLDNLVPLQLNFFPPLLDFLKKCFDLLLLNLQLNQLHHQYLIV